MKNKNALVYIITIPALVIVLAVLWILMITGNTTNQTTVTSSNGGMSTSNNSNGGPGGMQGSSSATYSAAKEVTEDATITSGEYTSSTADENAFQHQEILM